jgi:hypothetical protein
MTTARVPSGLGAGGRSLWRAITGQHEDLGAAQLVQLEEVCRAKDRLDKLDEILRGDTDTWASLVKARGADEGVLEVRVSGVLMKANETANVMKMLLAALRLPDEATGKRPQRRGARGAYNPSASKGEKVSSLDRARAAKSG